MEGQLVRGDASLQFAVLLAALEMTAVQFLQQVELAALTGIELWRFKVEDRRLTGAEADALVGGGHEAGRPVATAAGRVLGVIEQDDVARQVLAGAAKTVQRPRAQARPPAKDAAGVH